MTTLLESKARPYGSRKGAALSVALHGALIAAAVVASGRAVLPEREKTEEHSILYVAPPPPPKVHVAPEPLPEVKKPPAAKAPAAPRRVAAPPPRPSQPRVAAPAPAIVAPVTVPTNIPPVNFKAVPTVNVDIVLAPRAELPKASGNPIGGSAARSTSDGDVEGRSKGALGSGSSGRAYSENQVERAVVPTRAPAPRYPDALRSVSVQGEVIVQYIVDARGRVEPGSIKVLSAAHQLFADAVRRALLDARYRPAEVGGRPVRQLVEQPFIFKLDR
ncbi:MAG: TonB family protein [Gemmatimonadota bacterium]|nr:TonB family protein [Gemmatimonadota bacterium]